MKKYLFFLVSLAILLSGCTKKSENSSSVTGGLSPDDQVIYNNILSLQDKAAQKFDSLSRITDSLTAINQLQQFFLTNANVSSATLGSQGIAVQYKNGMRGGIFFNPEDYPADSLLMREGPNTQLPPILHLKSFVNNKNVIFLNPSFWERSFYANKIINNYNTQLPAIGFNLQTIYENQAAVVDRFTELSGYGIIHIYSHGLAWPDKNNIIDIYLKTGEVANNTTTTKYAADIKKGNILISNSKTSSGKKNIYWINEPFIASHNDFSKDTVLFYGGFCFSFCGSWPAIQSTFAQGTYFGFTWSVHTENNAGWNISLIDSLCDTAVQHQYHPLEWLMGTNPPKSYWDDNAQKTVYIRYEGDDGLSLWRRHYYKTYTTRPITQVLNNPFDTLIMTTRATISGASLRIVDTSELQAGLLFINIPKSAEDSNYYLTITCSNLTTSRPLPQGWTLHFTQVTLQQTGQQTIDITGPPWNATLQFNVSSDADYWSLGCVVEVLKENGSLDHSDIVTIMAGAINPDPSTAALRYNRIDSVIKKQATSTLPGFFLAKKGK
jgi:hypothetical protein